MPEVKKIATRVSYGKALAELGEIHEDIVVMDADLAASTQTAIFGKKFPDRFFDVGIQEGNMMGIAAGLATTGKKVFASSFAMFATGRAYEIIRNSIAYPRLNVKVCASHAGVSVGEDGKFEFGKGITLRDGSDVTIVASGLPVTAAMEACDLLAADGISARLINIHTIKPIDEELLVKAAKETGKIVTVEEHSVIGGLGGAVCEAITEKCPVPVRRIGLHDVFGESGPALELYKKYGLDAQGIYAQTKEFVEGK